MRLEDIDISKLLPFFMRREKDNLAMSAVISETLQPLAAQIAKLSTWEQLDKLNTSELDALASELSIFWYDKTLSDAQKRLLISESDKVYMKLGTKAAVLRVIREIFGEASIEEWFEYGGQPHFFRIRVADSERMTPENEAKLMRVLDLVKRKSQWLDSIQTYIRASFPINYGFSLSIHQVIRVSIDVYLDHAQPAVSQIGPLAYMEQTGAEQPTINIAT